MFGLFVGYLAALAGISLCVRLGPPEEPPEHDVRHLWANVPVGSNYWNLTVVLNHLSHGRDADLIHRVWLSNRHVAMRAIQSNWRAWEQLDPKLKDDGPLLLATNLNKLRDHEPLNRGGAAQALADPRFRGDAAAKVLAALTEALSDHSWYVRKKAAYALGTVVGKASDSFHDLGDSAAKAVAALMEAVGDEDTAVRTAAADALGKALGKAKAVSALIESLRDENWDVRESAASALGELAGRASGDAAARAAVALMKALSDADSHVRESAANALGKVVGKASDSFHYLGDSAARAMSALTETLRDEDWGVRGGAADALGEIFGSALHNFIDLPDAVVKAVTALMEALRDTDYVKTSAAYALGIFLAKAPYSFSDLRDAVVKAVRALTDVGVKAVVNEGLNETLALNGGSEGILSLW